MAIYLLGILPQVPALLLWAMLFIVSGVYLGATQSLPAGANGWQYLWKGFGTVLLIWGVLALLGGFAGNRDFHEPAADVIAGRHRRHTGRGAGDRRASVRAREEPARTEGRLAEANRGQAGDDRLLRRLVHWIACAWRRRLCHAAVKTEMTGRFALLQVDVTDPNDAEGRAMKQRFGVFGPPAMLFFDSNGAERSDLRATASAGRTSSSACCAR